MDKLKTGMWSYDPKENTIDCDEYNYWIDLDGCHNSAEVMDWIIQLSKKRWVSSQSLGDLVRLFDELLNIQGNYCGCGISSEVKDVKQTIKDNIESARRFREMMVEVEHEGGTIIHFGKGNKNKS